VSREEIFLVYDRECPACNAYCKVVRIRESVGDLQIIDARENSEVMKEITFQGHDIDQGMILKMGGQLYYGADAMHALALIGSRLKLCVNQKSIILILVAMINSSYHITSACSRTHYCSLRLQQCAADAGRYAARNI